MRRRKRERESETKGTQKRKAKGTREGKKGSNNGARLGM